MFHASSLRDHVLLFSPEPKWSAYCLVYLLTLIPLRTHRANSLWAVFSWFSCQCRLAGCRTSVWLIPAMILECWGKRLGWELKKVMGDVSPGPQQKIDSIQEYMFSSVNIQSESMESWRRHAAVGSEHGLADTLFTLHFTWRRDEYASRHSWMQLSDFARSITIARPNSVYIVGHGVVQLLDILSIYQQPTAYIYGNVL